MKKSILAIVLLVATFSASSVSALTIDFRDNVWETGDGSASFTYGDVTLTAWPYSEGATLWHDSIDGIGVRHSYEADEIESNEILQVSFASDVTLETIYLSDFFYEYRSGSWYNEIGYYSLDDGNSWILFTAPDSNLPSPSTNGEMSIAVGVEVSSVWFRAPGIIGTEDHDFALQMLDITAVPEPSTLLLLGTGLAGLLAFNRKRKYVHNRFLKSFLYRHKLL